MDIAQRLELFFRRLTEAPPAGTAQEALALVCRIIEEVEDEHCPVPRQIPPPLAATGRMYAPESDNIKPSEDGELVAITKKHFIVCAKDGGITAFYRPTGETVLNKEGKR